MDKQMWYAIIAVILMALIPLMPKLVRMRIWLLRKLHWNRLADWHERAFHPIVRWVRITLGALVIVLLVLAFGG